MKVFSRERRNVLKAGVAGAAALFLPGTGTANSGYGIAGEMAPELDISDWIDGDGKPTTFKLADHKGKFVFMEFWQSWCPACHSHGFPTLKKITDAFEGNKYFTAVAIQTTFEGHSVNTADKMREVQQRYDLNIVFGHDAGDPKKWEGHPKTMIEYRSGGTPWAVLISPEGKVLFNDFLISSENAIKVLREEIAGIAGA